MSLALTLLEELEAEAATTRRVFDRIPDAHLAWAPHPKSRTLGQLAMHLAQNPGGVMALAAQNPATFPEGAPELTPASMRDVHDALTVSLAQARELLAAMSDADLAATWRVTANGAELMAMPRQDFLRTVLLNHWYHHRGQLTVYLRLLDLPLPSVYGPSADENPFM
ncbi:DinB family protein [Gemmatimonas sp.]